MARISGINLDDNWKLDFALTKIKGIGWTRSTKVLEKLGMEKKMRVKALNTDDINKIANELGKYEIEGDLIRKTRENIQRLKVIGSYRGMSRTTQPIPSNRSI